MAEPILTTISMATAMFGALRSGAPAAVNATNAIAAGARTHAAVSDRLNHINSQNSLTDIAKLTRVQPLTILDNDVLHYDGLTDVLQSALSIFTGYYLQALAVLGSVQAAKVVNTLAALNPNSSSFLDSGRGGHLRYESYAAEAFSHATLHDRLKTETEGSWKMATESYMYSLPKSKTQFGFEAIAGVIGSGATPVGSVVGSGKNADKDVSKDLGKETQTAVREVSNLAVGKMVNVTLSDSDNSDSRATLPISIRLATNVMSSKLVEALLTQDSAETTLTERYHAWRSGQIEFIRDLMLCQDLIDSRKKRMMQDKSGVYSSVIAQANNNSMNGLTKRDPSLASASNIVVLSEATQAAIESKVGKLSDVRVRNKMFQSGYMMLMVIIDKRYDRVTFYHRGIAASTSVAVRDIKVSNKGGGPDLMDMMKMIGLAQAPTF